MKTSERVLFIIGVILTAAALLLACFAAYFGISSLISLRFHGVQGTESIGVAFMLVFLVIFSFATWAASLLAAILLLIRPVRTQHPRVRRWSRVLLILLLATSLLLGVIFLLCL